MEFLREQKNKLFDLVIEAEFSPLQFEITEPSLGNDSNEMIFKYKGSRYYFRFYDEQIESFPDVNMRVRNSSTIPSFDRQVFHFKSWLTKVKREISQPDKWAELLKSSNQVKWIVQEGENSQFSYQEVEEIQGSISRAKIKITELGLVENHLRLIEAKLDYIGEKAKTLGRIDWKNLMIGTLIGLIAQLAIPPEMAQTLWAIFKETFQRIILISLR